MNRFLQYSLALLLAFTFLSCGAPKGKKQVSGVTAESVFQMDSSAFDYPSWFPLGTEKFFPNSHVIYVSNPQVPKYLDKDIRFSVFADEYGVVKFRATIGDRTYEYYVEKISENAGRIMAPIKQEYKRMKVSGKGFELVMQHALDIQKPDLIRKEGFRLSLMDQEIAASTSYFNAEMGKWGSMLMKK